MLREDIVEDFEATIRENKKNGQKNITVPKAISKKYVANKKYFIYVREKRISRGEFLE